MKRLTYYEHAQACLAQWGESCRRPQYWVNLKARGMYAMFPIPDDRPPPQNRKIDHQSIAIQRAFGRMTDERLKGILYGHYVVQVTFDQAPKTYKICGVGSRTRYYELLKDATIQVFNASKKLADRTEIAYNAVNSIG